jgi:hypothetical protein
MSVTSATIWKGKREEIVPIAGKLKPLLEKHGAELVEVGVFYSGPNTGQFLGRIRYPDWEAFGRAQQAMAKDPEFQKVMTEALGTADLQSRSVVVSVDF